MEDADSVQRSPLFSLLVEARRLFALVLGEVVANESRLSPASTSLSIGIKARNTLKLRLWYIAGRISRYSSLNQYIQKHADKVLTPGTSLTPPRQVSSTRDRGKIGKYKIHRQ
ncbi:unnamed protein product [Clavelina lepadiformis]|uniref:Uncharacterized protein n=1 Tax=Clavelina lepadiformis TaxID=159417 RepID=A0ABP0G1X2_CLALP